MRVLPTLLIVTLLAACGYKGPLYLPDSKPGAQQPATKPAPRDDKPGS